MSRITDYLLEMQNNQHHQWARQHRAEILIIFAVFLFILIAVHLAM
jgi:hypothetical protein